MVAVAAAAAAGMPPTSPPPPAALLGRRVLITGASSGIGRELALAYARRGARLALAARRLDKLQSVAAECAAEWAQAGAGDLQVQTLRMDASSEGDMLRVVEEVEASFGGSLDVLILNHAFMPEGYVMDSVVSGATAADMAATARRQIAKTNSVNVGGAAFLAMATLPLMERSDVGGQIVVVGSAAADTAPPTRAAYSASKAAMGAYFRSLGRELRGTASNVRVSLIHLGLIGSETVMENKALHSLAMPSRDCAEQILAVGSYRVEETSIPWATVGLGRVVNMVSREVGHTLTRLFFLDKVPYVQTMARALSQANFSAIPLR